jgi:signal transduction histidine kinase
MLLRSRMNGDVAVLGLNGRRALRVKPEMTISITAVFGVVLQTMRRHEGERRQLEYERQAAIGRRMETIGTLASGMAHNLNNIIAAIAGFNALNEMHVAPKSIVGRSVADIDIALQRAQAVIREVLNFGRRLERTLSDINVSELQSETAAMLAVSLPSKVLLQADKPIGHWRVLGNFGHLQQVLLNICFNAAQAMTAGGTIRWENRHVVVKEALQMSHAVVNPGPYVTISIRDEGQGIEPAIVQHIFDRFFTTRANGTGLGLSTARDIVEQHGGTIDVQSMRGKGSSFTLWLPTLPESAVGEEPAPSGGGEVVLVINADAARLAIDEELVAALGYEPSGLCDTGAIDDFEGYVDMVLIAGIEEQSVAAALNTVRLAKWGVPILVAAKRSTSITLDPALSYPLQPVELASALSETLKSLEARVSCGAERGGDLTVSHP